MDTRTQSALEFARDHFELAESRLFDHISATFRWLMATLFVANGGAIVALLGADAKLPGQYFAAGWFSLGVIFTFFMGIASVISAYQGASRANIARAQVEEGLSVDKDATAAVLEYLRREKTTWKTFYPSYLGVVSLSFFIAGVCTIAGSLIRATS